MMVWFYIFGLFVYKLRNRVIETWQWRNSRLSYTQASIADLVNATNITLLLLTKSSDIANEHPLLYDSELSCGFIALEEPKLILASKSQISDFLKRKVN